MPESFETCQLCGCQWHIKFLIQL